jgi:MFS family permease
LSLICADIHAGGQKLWPLRAGQDRPDLDYGSYPAPTLWTYVGVFQNGFEWKNAAISMLDTLRTTFFPAVVWCVLANTVYIVANQAVGQIAAFALLAQGWQFQYIGLSVLPFFAASILVYVFAGPVADRISNAVTKWNGGGREAEHHLANLVVPFVAGVAGCFIFGYSAQQNLHWAVLLVGSFLIIFGFLTVMSVLNVFIIESYPMWAGPVLVNVSSLRIIIAFFFATQATIWIMEKGPMQTFAIYAEVMIVLSLGIPLLYFFGKKLRRWTAGKVQEAQFEKRALDDSNSV